jgi:hypothetical protein
MASDVVWPKGTWAITNHGGAEISFGGEMSIDDIPAHVACRVSVRSNYCTPAATTGDARLRSLQNATAA